ncbi:ankyrin repeat-containing domain protein [Ochromonadaceae sp. CCMP2298]|nr:ankyrin repeat-containing domain protein [Ochromonadaceae sp. CCMP2298]
MSVRRLKLSCGDLEGKLEGIGELVEAAAAGACNLTPLALACAHSQLSVVRELLHRGALTDTADDEGSTPLHHLARAKKGPVSDPSDHISNVLAIFSELKKHHISDEFMSAADLKGDTALLVACDNKNPEFARALLEEGASAVGLNRVSGLMPLHRAIKRRSVDLVQMLLEYGADPLAEVGGESCLELASKLHPDSIIYQAVRSGARAWELLRGGRGGGGGDDLIDLEQEEQGQERGQELEKGQGQEQTARQAKMTKAQTPATSDKEVFVSTTGREVMVMREGVGGMPALSARGAATVASYTASTAFSPSTATTFSSVPSASAPSALSAAQYRDLDLDLLHLEWDIGGGTGGNGGGGGSGDAVMEGVEGVGGGTTQRMQEKRSGQGQ